MSYNQEPMHSDIAISVRNISKKFRLFSSPKDRLFEALHPFRKQCHQEFWALRDVVFDIYRGEIIGIMGRNGSGKSTLLQIICSVMQATQGEVQANGRISALLELGAGFNPEFTGRDNVLLNGAIMGISRKEMLSKLPEIEEFADVGEFFDQPVKTYSSGMYVRVAFAAAIHVDPEILVVDEALSVGDSKFQHRCFQRIQEFMKQGKTILVVSHSTDTLQRICNRGLVLESGELKHIGPIAEAVNHYHNLLYGSLGHAEESIAPKSNEIEKNEIRNLAEISALSNDVTDRVSEHPFYNKHETRLGEGLVKVIDFDLVVDGVINPPVIPTNKEAELTVKIFFEEALSEIAVGFAVVSLEGVHISGQHLGIMGLPLLSAEAGRCMAVKFKWRTCLAGGEYFLNIGCSRFANQENIFIDVRRSVAVIKLAETPGTTGFVDFDVKCEVINLDN